MNLTIRTDSRVFREKMRRARAAGSRGGREAVVDLASGVMRRVEATSPRDTNRYVRAWQQANNAAGLQPMAVASLSRSSRHHQIRRRVEAQLKFAENVLARWNRNVATYEAKRGASGARVTRSEREAVKIRNQWVKIVERAQVMLSRLAEGETIAGQTGGVNAAILIGGRRRKRGGFGRTSLARVDVVPKGGDGRQIEIGGRWFVQVHNREPHATLVEHRYRVFGRAIAMARFTGVRRAGRSYLNRIRLESGLRRVA